MASRTRTPFLTAHWRWLLMVNYRVDPAVLEPMVPRGTELDLWRGECLASMVGFLFDDTKLFGRVPIPLHRRFDEVNLRFYVKRVVDGEERRGVVFVKELVPSRSVTFVARTLFREKYERAPMRYRIDWRDEANKAQGGDFCYQWRQGNEWSTLRAETAGPLKPLEHGSLAEFITEHYWGYSRQRDGGTLEYAVEHPRWGVWDAESVRFEADVASLYGAEFATALSSQPHSALVAEGSDVSLFWGVRIA
ncbi:MAG: DUF2071 domain-containing protein [Planctomycetota bacterium]